jgi:hypothetical protein
MFPGIVDDAVDDDADNDDFLESTCTSALLWDDADAALVDNISISCGEFLVISCEFLVPNTATGI